MGIFLAPLLAINSGVPQRVPTAVSMHIPLEIPGKSLGILFDVLLSRIQKLRRNFYESITWNFSRFLLGIPLGVPQEIHLRVSLGFPLEVSPGILLGIALGVPEEV